MELQRTITLKVKGNEYVVSYPTVGQFMRLEALKQQLTGGQYGTMASSNLVAQYDALEFVDIVANLTVLIPQVQKDLNKVSFEDIDALDFAEIRTEYREKFMPWMTAWYQALQNVGKKTDEPTK
jgi:broad specificity phosphatase PhoE